MTVKFSWGTLVRTKEDASEKYHPGRTGEVVATTEILDQRLAELHQVDIGTIVYLVEFGDGTSTEIPEAFLTSES